jgi:hypothetical protein
MASSLTLYNIFGEYIFDGTLDLDSNTINLALVTSSYTPALTHTIWANVSANEVATGDGYTTGGETITQSVTRSTGTTKFDAADVTWTALTKTFRYGVLYAVGTLNTIVNPLIGYTLFDTTPADITVNGVDWTVQWNANGIITVS